jgi:phosphonate degradation associated HDIG domain protein
MIKVFDEIYRLFALRGDTAYFGEPVSQTEHALQTAHLAEGDGATQSLVVAALLHDIGHLIHGLPEDIAQQGMDARHEEVGKAWLARYFGREVTEPVKMHVPAKRYLCRVDQSYLRGLSPASLRSLELQGGLFSGEEAAKFEKRPYFSEAVRLRRWDDMAKVRGLVVPELNHYRPAIVAAAHEDDI